MTAESNPKLTQTISKELLNVGNSLKDPLLINKKNSYQMPPSSVLSQVKLFLPAMKEANSKLEEQLSEDLNIENIAECEQEIIEMNLSFFAHDCDDKSSSDDDVNDKIQDDTSDTDREAVLTIGEITTANIKLPNRCKTSFKKRTIIEDISEDPSDVKGKKKKENNGTMESENDGLS